MNRHLGLLVAAVLLSACSATETKPEARRDPPFVMPHSPHVEAEVDCLECHAPITKAKSLENRVRHVQLPKKGESCSGCHDAVPKLQIPARTRDFGLHFDHAAHLGRLKGEKNACLRCHTSLPEQKGTEYDAPSMSACTSCHNHAQEFAAARCLGCHEDLKRYEKPVESFKHQGEFLKLHGALARGGAENCAACHEQTFCADCHSPTTVPGKPAFIYPEDVKRDLIHRGDYQSRHVVDVQANPASCRKCHGSNFCLTCHEQQNLMQPYGSTTPIRNPHPPGPDWANNKAGGNFHGDAARRNIVTCAGCHDQGADSVCVACHTTGRGMPSPHPKSWKKSAADISKNSMCAACHR
jgi:Cytochrome c7 and related cytochrome c